MAWTAPITWTPGSALTAAQLNVHLRDNMLETEAGLASQPGGYFVGNSVNNIDETTAEHDEITTSETRAVATYADLATVGPTCTVTLRAQALVIWSAQISGNGVGVFPCVSVDMSGANTATANDSYAMISKSSIANSPHQHMHHLWYTGLAAGSTTFKLKYQCLNPGTATFAFRRLVVLPY